jgi:hypothetical protein
LDTFGRYHRIPLPELIQHLSLGLSSIIIVIPKQSGIITLISRIEHIGHWYHHRDFLFLLFLVSLFIRVFMLFTSVIVSFSRRLGRSGRGWIRAGERDGE